MRTKSKRYWDYQKAYNRRMRKKAGSMARYGLRQHNYIDSTVAAARLLNTMNLDEMLEASDRIRNQKYSLTPSLKRESENAVKYADMVNRMHRRSQTMHKAEKMERMLVSRIVKVNEKTVDMQKAEISYKAFIGAE